MKSLLLAIKFFFGILTDEEAKELAEKFLKNEFRKEQWLKSDKQDEIKTTENVKPEIKKSEAEPQRQKGGLKNDAVILLSTLQREARFIDFIKESLDSFTDAQIGAASRSVHRETKKTLERIFGIKELSENPEGNSIEIPQPADPDRYNLTGNVTSSANRGIIRHCGWKITRCEMPVWNGDEKNKEIISPMEVEI